MEYGTHSEYDLPDSALESAVRDLKHFAVSFVVKQRLQGSGTLLRIDNRYGILTARHVWDIMANKEYVGLNIAESAHCFSLPQISIRTWVVAGEPGRLHGTSMALLGLCGDFVLART
jgi:hypothetical protein